MIDSTETRFDLGQTPTPGSNFVIQETTVAKEMHARDITESPRRNTLRWARLPEGETKYSDWQIDVRFISGDDFDKDETISYLVHRYAIGPQSTYFNVAFDDNNGFSESRVRRSTIQLPADRDITRTHFEYFLDFMYDSSTIKKLELDPDKALAMLYLADYFGVQTAREQVQKFLQSELNSPTCSGLFLAKLYSLAEFLSLEELQDAIANTKFRQRLSIKVLYDAITNDIRLDTMPLFFPSFWSGLKKPELKHECLHRMCRVRKKRRDKTSSWSALISCAIIDSPQVVDKDLFSELTEKEIMPYVETLHAALIILKHEKLLGLDRRDWDWLTCLQQRCTKAIYDELWERQSIQLWRLVYATPEEILDDLRRLKPSVVRIIKYNGPPNKRVCTR